MGQLKPYVPVDRRHLVSVAESPGIRAPAPRDGVQLLDDFLHRQAEFASWSGDASILARMDFFALRLGQVLVANRFGSRTLAFAGSASPRPKHPAFPAAGSVVQRVTGTVAGSDSLCPASDSGSRLIRRLAAHTPSRASTDRRASPVDSTTFRTCHDLYPGKCRTRSKAPTPVCRLRQIHRGSPLPPCHFGAAVFASCGGPFGCHLLSRLNTALRPRDLASGPPLAAGILGCYPGGTHTRW